MGSAPALAGFENESGAGERRQDQEDPEPLRLELLHRMTSSHRAHWATSEMGTYGPIGACGNSPSVPGLDRRKSQLSTIAGRRRTMNVRISWGCRQIRPNGDGRGS